MRQALEFTLGTDNSAFNSGLRAARSSVASFKNQVGGMVTGMFAGIGIQQLVSDFARVQDLADQFGTTAEAIQRVSGAADLAGTNVEVIARAMAKIRSDGGDALEKLGIDAEAFKAAGMDQQILMISQALEQIPDPQERINKALEIFGARGREILPLLMQGYDDLKASIESVSVASDETVAKLAQADDRLADFGNKLKVGGAEVFGFFSDRIEDISAMVGFLGYTIAALPKGLTATGQAAEDYAKSIQTLKSEREAKRAAKAASMLSTGEGGAPAVARDLNAEIAKLEQDAADKLLPIYEQLGKNGLERLNIEREIAKTTDPDKKKELEDKLLQNVKERLSLEDQQRKDDEQWQNTYAKQLEDEAKDREKEADKAAKQAEKDAKKKADIEEQQMRALFDRRQNDIGFASGISVQGATMGQQLAGVNYSVVNAEAQKQVQLQEQMRDYLAAIEAKKWSVEIPEAS